LISFPISIKAKANHNGEGILNTFPKTHDSFLTRQKMTISIDFQCYISFRCKFMTLFIIILTYNF